jgi:FkbM family methyltransferase
VHLATQEFIDEEYSQLDVKKRDVVDIGGSIGDSAIYFALRGARRVYSFEPFPHTFELARRNIRLNGLGAKVKLLNKAVSGAGGSIHIRKDFGVRIDSNLSDGMSARGKRIGIVSLDSIVSRYKVKNAVLKIDCEGSEYGIIQKASRKALGAFSQIMIEYHYGYMDLERKLGDAGFRVTHTIPKYAAYYNTMRPAMYIGKVLATREW